MERLEQLARKLRGELPGLELREEEPMRNHTTFRIGGPARLMALPRNGKEAAAAVRLAAAEGVAPFFLGNGSNLLVADGGSTALSSRPPAWIRPGRNRRLRRSAASLWPGWPWPPWAGASPAWSSPTVSPAPWGAP